MKTRMVMLEINSHKLILVINTENICHLKQSTAIILEIKIIF